eukprot:gene12551-19432_t
MDILREIGQEWLTEDWPKDGSEKEQQEAFFDQVRALNDAYPGGLKAYVNNARRLLQDSKDGRNPFESCTPEMPTAGETLDFGKESFLRREAVGAEEVKKAGFVLVAGGLGERLGYNGIKLQLPVETTTNICYLQFYVEYLNALGGSDRIIPLAIMTSGDTHDKTVALLEAHNYFGRARDSITLMRQGKVPSLCDNSGRFVKESKYSLETKPHGHGDVHQLMHSTGVAKRWASSGVEWVVFIQDTNALVFNSTQGALGLAKEKGLDVNSIAIARKPGEAIGAIARLVQPAPKHPVTVCVEYNQLDPLLRSTINKEGDVADPKTGFSPFPGNINTLIFRLQPYLMILEETQGLMPEFVNPKYADADKNVFKKPTRLECMMQDYPKLVSDPTGSLVGFTAFSRDFVFSPVKNSKAEALAKLSAGLDANSPGSGEAEFYEMNAQRLRLCGVSVADEKQDTVFGDIPVKFGARVVLHPTFAPTQAALASKVDGNVSISSRSTLVVEGANIKIDDLTLDGALVIKIGSAASLHIKKLSVHNRGWQMVAAPDGSDEAVRIRGFVFEKLDTRVIEFSEGSH